MASRGGEGRGREGVKRNVAEFTDCHRYESRSMNRMEIRPEATVSLEAEGERGGASGGMNPALPVAIYLLFEPPGHGHIKTGDSQ